MKYFKNKKLDILANFLIVFVLVSLLVLSSISLDYSMSVFADDSDVYYHGDIESNKVSLMFNVYWGTEYLDEILAVLEKYSVNVTFFVGGSWADDNKEYLDKFIAKGHEIGNHGYFHKNHSNLDLKGNEQEIKTNNILIKNLVDYDMNLFAPPSGAYSNKTLTAAKNLNMKVIMWSIDTIDWRDHNTELIYNKAKKAKGGDFVLMHPTQNTLESLDMLIKYYLSQNLLVVTVSNNLNKNV